MKEAQAVQFKQKLYVGAGTAIMTRWDSAVLYVYTLGANTWNRVDTPVYDFALATYRSKIVLVGGRKYMHCDPEKIGNITDILWTSDSEPDELSSWQKNGLPCMKVKRCGASAVGNKDILVVAGGNVSSSEVEIYDGSQWWMVNQPSGFHAAKSLVLFDECLYLMSGISIRYTTLVSLKTSYQSNTDVIWKELTDIPQQLSWSNLAVFGNRLIVTNGTTTYAYSHITQCWVHACDTPDDLKLFSACAVGLPSEDLMILGGQSEMGWKRVIQVTWKRNSM